MTLAGQRVGELAAGFDGGSPGCVEARAFHRPVPSLTSLLSAPTKENLLIIRVTIDSGWHFLGLPSARPHPAPQGCRHVLHPRRSSEVLAADPGARLSSVTTDCCSPPTCETYRHRGSSVCYVRGGYDCGGLASSWQIRCRAGSISPTELTSRRIGTWADMFCRGTCKR